ncbi:hypothetical protein COL26_21600 [Bacillus thuringiensis]|uniref:Uncharacterized protein n=1 Tax=Bacillus thuringiensis TaxID=1428 RepID=A0ABD6RZY8_BACTU|nr:hypothetical protein [Bacillus thuringiensis]PER42601.1 hypothetical protein CN495_32500 [Bacillus thuringiensis]PEU82511.1 hypothetical protein CN411_23855 [Bacillus thuringiensis]PFI11238.1 hypothetical protein COI79_05990 [Bacillus thuringiensis]PFN36592.1 hypothetical protein COJ56_23505 [Bacillus thuringiensis]PFW34683.1 hypothetical protein COL26_21600 [Bacillus thuringiensis]
MKYITNVYMYNKEFSKATQMKIYKYITSKQLKKVIVQRSIQNGHHISVIFWEKEDQREFIEYMENIIKGYLPETIDKEKLRKKIQVVSRMEEVYPQTNIRDDGAIESFESNKIPTFKINPIYSNDVFEEVELIKTKLMIEFNRNSFFKMDQDEQNIMVAQLYLNAGLLHKSGLKFGYLSLKSNILLFEEQLKSIKEKIDPEKYKKYWELVFNMTELEHEFIEHGLAKFFDTNKSGFFRKYIHELNNLFLVNISKNTLDQQNISSGEKFFENGQHLKEIPEFHNTFFNNKYFLNEYKSEHFISYKYVMDTLYQLMLLLNISPIRKQKITKIASDAVEAYYQTNWKEVYQEMISMEGKE